MFSIMLTTEPYHHLIAIAGHDQVGSKAAFRQIGGTLYTAQASNCADDFANTEMSPKCHATFTMRRRKRYEEGRQKKWQRFRLIPSALI